MAYKTYILAATLIYTALSIILTALFLHLIRTLPALNPQPPLPRFRGTPIHLLIILGSGGHTAEMLSLLHTLDPRSYTHRTYVLGSGDGFSALKAREFEEALVKRMELSGRGGADEKAKEGNSGKEDQGGKDEGKRDMGAGTYTIRTVPRARKIHQSVWTAPFSCLHCLLACLHLLTTAPEMLSPLSHTPKASTPPITAMPDLILLNGPATATILVFASLLLRVVGARGSRGKMRSIYVESWARVRRLSLSGRMLVAMGACERVLVQWSGLQGRGVEFRGCLVK